MAYEKVKLVVAGLSGDIYMSRIKQDGTMSDSRRKATDDCLRATTEWFMRNKEDAVRYGSVRKDEEPHLFYTSDKEKAKKILEILREDKE